MIIVADLALTGQDCVFGVSVPRKHPRPEEGFDELSLTRIDVLRCRQIRAKTRRLLPKVLEMTGEIDRRRGVRMQKRQFLLTNYSCIFEDVFRRHMKVGEQERAF